MINRLRRFYGAHPVHLLLMIACFALLAYVIRVLGPSALWNPHVWWQSILVWFLGAVIAHDLVLFPLYALADRSLNTAAKWMHHRPMQLAVPPTNYIRIPALASGLLLLLFFPGIVQQGQQTYLAATGQTQQPFLDRWLLLVAAMFALSAIAYGGQVLFTRRRLGLIRNSRQGRR